MHDTAAYTNSRIYLRDTMTYQDIRRGLIGYSGPPEWTPVSGDAHVETDLAPSTLQNLRAKLAPYQPWMFAFEAQDEHVSYVASSCIGHNMTLQCTECTSGSSAEVGPAPVIGLGHSARSTPGNCLLSVPGALA